MKRLFKPQFNWFDIFSGVLVGSVIYSHLIVGIFLITVCAILSNIMQKDCYHEAMPRE